MLVFGGHALSFLLTAWSTRMNARIAYKTVSRTIFISSSVCVLMIRLLRSRQLPRSRLCRRRGKGRVRWYRWITSLFVELMITFGVAYNLHMQAPGASKPTYSFIYQRDTYILDCKQYYDS